MKKLLVLNIYEEYSCHHVKDVNDPLRDMINIIFQILCSWSDERKEII